MNIGVSEDMCLNIAALCRIIRQPKCNGLLLGRNSCGRKSMTKIACQMMNCHYNEWKNDENWEMWMKEILMKVICSHESHCVFFEEWNLNS